MKQTIKTMMISILAALMLLLMGPVGSNMGAEDSRSPVRETGSVITIAGNLEFDDQASANGWAGDGSPGNPYIIEDLEINGSDHGHCIRLENTTRHFVIKDCFLHGVDNATDLPAGILLWNVTNGSIENVTCTENGDSDGIGIMIAECENITVSSSLLYDNGHEGEGSVGLYIASSINIDVQDSEFHTDVGTEFAYGVYCVNSKYLNFSRLMIHNSTSSGEGGGIAFEATHYCRVIDCIIFNNTGDGSNGIYSEGSDNITVAGCEIFRNQNKWSSHGISLEMSNNWTIENNKIYAQNFGVRLDGSNGHTIMNNHFEDHEFGFYLWFSDDNWIENNTIVDTELSNLGSCPFLYTWNGDDMEMIGDVNGMGGLGYSFDMTVNGGDPFMRRPPTSKDYTAIDPSQLKAKDGHYVLEMVEEQDEITYFDEADLWVIDHPEDVEIYNPEAALCTFGQDLFPPMIHTVKDPIPPQWARDWNGNDIMDVISERDGDYTDAELLNDNYITMDLGDLSGAPQIKLLYSAYTDWAPIGELKENVYAEVIGPEGTWELVSEDEHLGKPEAYPRTWVMDITDWFKTDDYRLRLHTGNIKIHVDWIAIDTSLDEPVTVRVLQPSEADHYFKGPTHPSFETFQGHFTKYGDVLPLVENTDDKYVIMKDGDAVRLKYPQQSSPIQDRSFWLVTDAYFKQPFLKHILGEEVSRVGPLPFHGMSNYPYPKGESYPGDPEHQDYIDNWNIRVIEDHHSAGMSLPRSDNNTVIRNSFNGSTDSRLLYIAEESNCSIIENELIGGYRGVDIYLSKNVLVKDNTIFSNDKHGIRISRSSFIDIQGNTLMDNNESGLRIEVSNNITVFNNYFDDSMNWNITDSEDIQWYVPIREGENILGGRNLGGNYWNNYTGEDLDGDMIGDTEVPFGPGDMFPLTHEIVKPRIEDATEGQPTTGDPFTLSTDVSDLGGLSEVFFEFWLDGGAHENNSIPAFENGTYHLEVHVPNDAVELGYFSSAIDASGNWNRTETSTLSIIDNDGPVFTDLEYPDTAGIGENSSLSVVITDNIALKNVTFGMDVLGEVRNLTYTVDNGTYHVEIPGSMETGFINLTITANDTTGNENMTEVSIQVIDDIPPEIEILHPSNGSYVSGVVEITAVMIDIGGAIDLVNLNISGNEVFNGTPGQMTPWIISWNTSEYDEGINILNFTAIDDSGNEVKRSIEVTVKNNFTSEEELRIVSTVPGDLEEEVGIDTLVQITFSVPVNTDSVELAALDIPNYTVSWENDDTVMMLSFSGNLSYSTIYTITIISAHSKIAAPLLNTPYEFSFTTMSETTVDDDDTGDDDTSDDDTGDDDSTDDDTVDDDSTEGDDKSEGTDYTVIGILLALIILILIVVIVVLFFMRSRSSADFEMEEE